jgi:serine/threonine-protein phosphatase 5
MKNKLYELTSLPKKVFVVGDLHGDLRSFEQIVEVWQKEENSHLILLGDYADRGRQGLEIIESLMKLTKEKGVVAMKGNHEDYSSYGQPNFSPCNLISEVRSKRGSWESFFSQKLKPFFNDLYISVLIPGSMLLVHGGISSKITSIGDLQNPTSEIEEDILWSDPVDFPEEKPNERGAGVEFGPDITDKVTKALDVGLIVRSHQPPIAKEEPYICHNGKVVTISSTRIYGGKPYYLEIRTDEILEIMKDARRILKCTRYVN